MVEAVNKSLFKKKTEKVDIKPEEEKSPLQIYAEENNLDWELV